MQNYRKTARGALAGCLAASALLMSAGAVSLPVQTAANPSSWGSPDSTIDDYGVDWAKLNTSMCVSGKDYHAAAQSSASVRPDARYYYSGWVYGVQKSLGRSVLVAQDRQNLLFANGESGVVSIQATDTTTAGLASVDIAVYDVTKARISDWVTVPVGGAAKTFAVDPNDEYRLFVSSQQDSANVRLQVRVGGTLQSQTPSTTVQLDTNASSQIIPWSVYTGYSNWSMQVANQSSSRVTISIYKDSPTGTLVSGPLYVEAGQTQSLPGGTLTAGAYYVDIHTSGSCNLAGSLSYQFGKPSGSTASTRTAVKISQQNASIYVEGVPAVFPSADGKTLYPTFTFNGTTYMQLRTVGKWMGKNVSWDDASRTVFLSGTAEKSYPSEDDEVYQQIGVNYLGASGTATEDKGVTVLLDGKPQTFKNQNGQTIYPMFYQNAIYLPLRNVGELTGLDVTWYSAQSANDVNAIFLRAPLTSAQQTDMDVYATGLMQQLLSMREDMKKFESAFHESRNGIYYDTLLTDRPTALAALDSIKTKAQSIRANVKTQIAPIAYYNTRVQKELDFLVSNADTMADRILKRERIAIATSDPSALDTMDSLAMHYLGDEIMLDCERMVRVIRQNMVMLF